MYCRLNHKPFLNQASMQGSMRNAQGERKGSNHRGAAQASTCNSPHFTYHHHHHQNHHKRNSFKSKSPAFIYYTRRRLDSTDTYSDMGEQHGKISSITVGLGQVDRLTSSASFTQRRHHAASRADLERNRMPARLWKDSKADRTEKQTSIKQQ